MSKEEVRKNFTAEMQAMLIAWIVKAAIGKAGKEKAEPAIKKAVIRYGEQRGKRMAMRATANQHPLTMFSYVLYGEWKVGEGEMIILPTQDGPNLRSKIPKCNWYTAWSANGLVEFGKYFCQSIDKAVVHGFNPQLKLEINAIKPDGSQECDFLFCDFNPGPINMTSIKTVMPWDYHAGHIYKTFKEVLTRELGPAAEAIMKTAMAEFAKRYGAEAEQIVKEYQDVDFDVLPIHKA
jgi:hypothetical protein